MAYNSAATELTDDGTGQSHSVAELLSADAYNAITFKLKKADGSAVTVQSAIYLSIYY